MINPLLKEKFPFVSNYFETLISNDIKKFPQSIVFEGLDTIGQYMFSMELARILNCTENGEEGCNCINCGWIKDIKHPAVNIVSPINYKDDASKTVISISQAKKVTSSLNETSDYHRVFIFCDAKIKHPGETESKLIKEYNALGYSFPEENWVPLPLTSKVFKAEASNSLLKSIEEPPERTTFIFLTQNREDIISTIVSRSNVFKLSNSKVRLKEGNTVKEIIGNYPYSGLLDALETSNEIEARLKAEEIDIFDFMDEFQEYILELIKQNLGRSDIARLKAHIDLIQTAKKRLKASMSPKIVLESLFLDFVK